MDKLRSPLFYVGDKYKLMPQLLTLFPTNINTFYDVFVGGGSASLNTNAQQYQFNDFDSKIMALHKYLLERTQNIDLFLNDMYSLIDKYGLTHSELGEPPKLAEYKSKYKKTYFAKMNKNAYMQLRDDYNKNTTEISLLYLLLVYGFNHMTRFNSSGMFNLPVGNVDWNKNVTNALKFYGDFAAANKPKLCNEDFEDFIKSRDYQPNDFVYLDPPYLITFSEYNKNWGEDEELRLYSVIDWLTSRGIQWGLSNILDYKGRRNDILYNWMVKYDVHEISSNYISRFDNTIKNSKEVYITNVSTEI